MVKNYGIIHNLFGNISMDTEIKLKGFTKSDNVTFFNTYILTRKLIQ